MGVKAADYFTYRSGKKVGAPAYRSIEIMRLLLFCAVLSTAHAYTDGDLLAAIAKVENHRWTSPGGKYALTYAAWSQHTTASYSLCHDKAFSTVIAYRHLNWLKAALKRKGIAATPYMLAGCWRSGLARFTSRRPPKAHRDYAAWVMNLLMDSGK